MGAEIKVSGVNTRYGVRLKVVGTIPSAQQGRTSFQLVHRLRNRVGQASSLSTVCATG